MKKSMKRLIALTLSATMVLSLAACTPTGSSNQNTQASVTEAADGEGSTSAAAEDLEVNTTDDITIRLNWWGGDSRHQATLDAVTKFQEKYPNIKVESEYEAWTGHEEKVALAMNSGTVADIIQINWSWPYEYSPNGDKFYDLNKLAGILELDNFDQDARDLMTINGSLQAIPISNTGRVFYWNASTFEKVGVQPPTTLDELYAVGEAFAEYEDGSYYPMAMLEYDRMILMVYYLESVYGKNWVEDGELQYTLEEVAAGYEFIQSLEDRHVIPSMGTLAGDGAESLDKNKNWMDGKYAGIYEWDSAAAKCQGALADGQEFIVGDFIEMGDYQGGFTKISMSFAVSAKTDHPAECAALIQFLLAEEEGVKILGDSRGIPANTKGLAFLEADLENNLVAEANQKVMDWAKFQLDPKFESAALKNNDGAYFLTMQMLSSGEDAQTCAEYLVDAINSELGK